MSDVSRTRDVFSPGVRRFVWIAVGVSVLGTLVAILFGSRVASPTPTERDSFTAGPLGHRALVETLERLDVHAVRERRGAYADVRAPMLFAEPSDLEATVGDRKRALADVLLERVEADRASVVVLPKWSFETGLGTRATPDPRAQEVLEAVLPGASLGHLGGVTDDMVPREATGALGQYELALPYPQVIDAPFERVMLAVDGRAVVVRRHDGVLVVSDPDLLHSWNLHRGDHALFWSDLLTHHLGTDTVAIDEVFHGHFARPSLGAALSEWPTVLLTGQVLFLLLLVVLIGSRRFGPAVDEPALGRGPAESIAVSAHVLSEGRPIGVLADAYVRGQIADLAEHLGLRPGERIEEQARHVDRVAKRRGHEPEAEHLIGAAAAVAAHRARRPNDAMQLARRAHALRERLLSSKE